MDLVVLDSCFFSWEHRDVDCFYNNGGTWLNHLIISRPLNNQLVCKELAPEGNWCCTQTKRVTKQPLRERANSKEIIGSLFLRFSLFFFLKIKSPFLYSILPKLVKIFTLRQLIPPIPISSLSWLIHQLQLVILTSVWIRLKFLGYYFIRRKVLIKK